MSVGSLRMQLAALPDDFEVTVCDAQGQDWPILAVTDGGEERSCIVDIGTQDDLDVAAQWPIGWDHV